MGAAQEGATEGGGGTDCLGKLVLCGNTGSAVVLVRDLGAVGANVADVGRSSYWVTATGDEVKFKKFEERFVAEDGGGKSTSWSGGTTAPDLLGQEVDNSGGMGGLTAYL